MNQHQDEEQQKRMIAFIWGWECLFFSFLHLTWNSDAKSLRSSIISCPSTLHHTTEALRFPASSFLVHPKKWMKTAITFNIPTVDKTSFQNLGELRVFKMEGESPETW